MPAPDFLIGSPAAALAQPTPPPPPGEVMPLVGYTPTWFLLGLALVALIAAYYLVVAVLHRQRFETAPPPAPEPPVDLAALNAAAVSEVSEVEALAHSGELGGRAAHERLSAIVRGYVAEATGIPADRMTLADLERSPLRGTTLAVARFYPAVFAADAPNDLDASLRAAREVLAGWR
ncbi:hypothetical protein [Gulosibacter macacae]|uniref:hypothetical protein n=1 Tax=Gulosibacter macacae TaxID=2488791 RepID=UPI00163A3759|nr:hypothetical protein [Gulosibacter macacae]